MTLFAGLLSTFFNNVYSQISDQEIYINKEGRKLLSKKFINAICNAARNPDQKNNTGDPSALESLILMASHTGIDDSLKANKVKKWHTQYGMACNCAATKKYPQGDFMRQVVHSNYRSFANKVGPKNQLPLNLNLKSPIDGLTIYEYINEERKRLEAKHHDLRFEFQKDELWRNVMFFYFLFSEFSIN